MTHDRPAAADAHPVRIGLVTDLHFADRPDRDGWSFRASEVKLAQCVEHLHLAGVDALVELGDFKDQDDPPDANRTREHLAEIEKVLQRFRGPVYHALGNHDIDSITQDDFLEGTVNTGIPPDRTWYAFDVRGVRGLVLDANFRGDGSPCTEGHVNWTDPHVPPAQLDWLRDELAAARGPAVVFVHHRLDPAPDPRFTIVNAAAVRAVLEASGRVRAVFQGHDHRGGLAVINGIPYLTLPAMFGTGLPVDTAYGIATIHPGSGRVTVAGFGRMKSMVLRE